MSECLVTSRVTSCLKHPASSTGPELSRSQSWKDSLPKVSAPCSLLWSSESWLDFLPCVFFNCTAFENRPGPEWGVIPRCPLLPWNISGLIPSIQCACARIGCESVKQASGESPCTPGRRLCKCYLLSLLPISLLQQSQVLPWNHQCYLVGSKMIWSIFPG